MKNPNSAQTSNFWFGFSLGVLTTGVLVYFFGTTNGRQTLKKMIDLTDNLEETLIMLADNISADEHGKEGNKPDSNHKKNYSTLETIIHKMKTLSPLLNKQ